MPTPAEEVIVRITAQLSELQAGMEQAVTIVGQANAEMVGSGTSAGNALKTSAADTSEAVGAAYTEGAATASASWTSAQEDMAAATNAFGETAAQVQARLAAVAKTAIETNGVIAESETSLAERQGQRVEATQAQIDANAALVEAQNAQMGITDGVISLTNEDTAATLENAAAKDVDAAATERVVINSRASAEVGTLLSEALAGNFGRIRRSASALANQTGILTKVLGFLMSPVGALTVGIGVLAAAALKGEEAESRLNGELIATGHYAGASAGQLDEMASNLTSATASIGRAREAVAALAATGRFTQDQMGTLAQATLAAGDLMGQSAQETVRQFTQLQDHPVQAIEKLNERMHFLTTAVMQQIVQLDAEGDSMGAARLAMDAYANTLTTRAQEADAQLGTLQRAWDSVKNSASFAWDAMMGIGRPLDKLAEMGQKLKDINQDLYAAREKQSTGSVPLWAELSGHGTGLTGKALTAHIAELEQQRAALNKQYKDLGAKASQAENLKQVQQQIQDAGVQASATLEKLGINLDGVATKTDKVKKAAEALFQIYQAGGKLPKGVDFNGPIADQPEGSGWEKIKKHLLGHHAKHKEHDKLPTLDPYAKQQMEQEYRAMQKAARQASQIQNVELQSYQQHEQAKTQIALDHINQREALGQITASQAIALRERLEQSLYQRELAEYQREIALLHDKPVEVAKMHAKIEALEDQHQRRMKHLQDQAQQANVQRWQKMLAPVQQAISGSVQGMIQGTQTAYQTITNLGRNMLASFINIELQKLIHFIAVQAGMTAAQVSGDQARTVSHAAAAVESKTIDAATGHAQINTAAATGAAKAYQAVVGIPFVGPILAPIAAGVAFAGIEAFGGGISSAEGGWERVPADGMMTQLHKNEQVLPASYAEGLRQLVATGGGGSVTHNHHYHISAWDGRSMKDTLRRNPHLLADAAMHAQRNGYA